MPTIRGTCTVDGCRRPHKARGYCQAHYQHFLRGVSITSKIRSRDTDPHDHCLEAECGEPVKAKGLCKMHYQRLLRHGHTRYTDRKKPAKQCSMAECENHVYAKGMCHLHYSQPRMVARKYGITIEQFQQMRAVQGGCCAICKSPERSCDGASGKLRELNVDHDHKTGAVRGLLCNRCNRALGYMDDSPERLRAAAAYLERFTTS